MNKIEGWVKDIDILYLCNKKRCKNCVSLGIYGDEDVCRHTLDEKYAISTRGIFEIMGGDGQYALVQKEIG